MEEIKWDREAFAKQQRVAGPGPGFSLGGILLLFITVGVVAGGGYWYLKTRGMAPNLPEINLPSLGSLNPGGTNERLETMELRLEQIEKRLNITTSNTAPKPNAARTTAASSGPRTTDAPLRRATGSLPADPATLKPSVADATASATAAREQVASREAWAATTDRLGMAVGELGEQRREIAQTQEDLTQLRLQMQRTYLPFELSKNAGQQRVGPILLDLQSTDRKNQRYNLVLQFDDRSVQMKDRALGERVEFYISGADEPLELVVSEILPDRIVGKLALPASAELRSR